MDNNRQQLRKPYKAKTLAGAERRVNDLMRKTSELETIIRDLTRERNALARLADDQPQFFNPLEVWAAKKIRDRVLYQLGLREFMPVERKDQERNEA